MFELIVSLAAVGVLLVFVELFVPGAIAGIAGALALLVSVALTYNEYGVDRGNIMLVCVIVFGAALLIWWMRSFSNSALGRKWTLHSEVPNDPAQSAFFALADRTGTALTELRPAGTAMIGGARIDVIAESEMIERGAAIRVVRVEGKKVVVRRG